MEIRLLPESVWSRIAAGEVVERPASAVKEMVENSLDAGALRIRVRLWDGGRLRIVVEDDGCGIAFDDLALALTPHATSKIAELGDLESIHTLGYRGEALPSLAAVAAVEIRSRPEGEEGGIIRASKGNMDRTRVACPAGTRVQVDEIFADFPARLKFLKSAAGELRRAAGVLREYAICRPEVAFALEHDGREIFATDGCGDRRRVLERLWGSEPAPQKVESEAGRLKLECWWQPRQGRNDIAAFVNGRAVTDPLVKGAVGAVARELTGNWALFFSLDPALIDVNIHPAKAEVRFRYPGEVFEAVRAAAGSLGGPAPLRFEGRSSSRSVAAHSGGFSSSIRAGSGGWNFSDTEPEEPRRGTAAGARPYTGAAPRPIAPAPASGSLFSRIAGPDFRESGPGEPCSFESPTESFQASEGGELGTVEAVSLGQMSVGYLVFDTPEGLAVMDPHAAHERVEYERIRRLAKEGGRAQALFITQPLPPTLALEAEEYRETLEAAGFAFESVDGALHVSSVPTVSGFASEPESLLRASLAALKAEGDGDPVELLWRAWATWACKRAVKLTTRLSLEESLALWRELHACEQPFFCPHGRPTLLRLSASQLSEHFERE
ncbi:MAG: DNA mismatch repair protein MutL [Fretibacterium sp.]|nr:DNA mismatch repair protein MutL [Fretibacterium sp.]